MSRIEDDQNQAPDTETQGERMIDEAAMRQATDVAAAALPTDSYRTSAATDSKKKGAFMAVGGAIAAIGVLIGTQIAKDDGGNRIVAQVSTEEQEPRRDPETGWIVPEDTTPPTAPPEASTTTIEVVARPGEVAGMRLNNQELRLPLVQPPTDPEACANSILDLFGAYYATTDERFLEALHPAGAEAFPDAVEYAHFLNPEPAPGAGPGSPDGQFLFFPDPNDPPRYEVIVPDDGTGKVTIALVGGRQLYADAQVSIGEWGSMETIEASDAEGLVTEFEATVLLREDGSYVVDYVDFYLGLNNEGNPYDK